MDPRHREALRKLLRRVDEVRGLEALPAGDPGPAGEETELLLRTAENLVDELERARRRLIETNVQLVSLREVAHSMVSSVDAEEATQTVTTYLHRAFGFEDVFLALVHRDEGVLEGTWTRKTGATHASIPFRVPLLGEPEGVLAKSVWQHRPFTIHDPKLHPPFLPAADSTLGDVLDFIEGFTAVPLQRSRTLLVPVGSPTVCDRDCPFGPSGRGTWYTPADSNGGNARWHMERNRVRRRCLDCPQFPILGVLGVGCRRAADLASVETALLESIALSVAPVVENARLYHELRRSERFRDHVLNSMANPLAVVNLEGRIVTFNRSAVELLGMSEDEARAKSLDQVFGTEAARLLLQTLRTGREHQRVETNIPRGTAGPAVQVALTTSLLRNERRAVYGAIATFIDLSRVKVMEERIRQLDRLAALGRFTSSVAHEIRNPLAGIAAGAQYLKKSIPPNHPDHENYRFILSEIARLDRIVGDLFHITHPQGLALRHAALPEIADKALLSLRPLIKEKKITIKWDVPFGLPHARVDMDQMQQVFINLIKNAIEASRPKSTILLRFMKKLAEPDAFPHPPGTMLVLASVVDDGVGIPKENLDRLFDPFFTTKKGGTGLGLYITHDIVKRHGGALRVASDPGRGTTFTIELPVEPIQEVEDGR
ncbi:MAG: two-component system sensor histidine kinase NtrB [Candidatus Eiseniibacteriota bacterium]